MHILVTGGAGFIGSHLVDALLEDGHDVTVFDNLSTGCRDQIPTEARFVEGDIRDEAALQALFEEGHFDVVFHEAAQTQVSYSLAHPREDAELNVIGLINVLEQCRRQGVQKFIYSSSAAVYGDNPKVPLSESEPLAPASFYGLTKVAAEKVYPALWQPVRPALCHPALCQCIWRTPGQWRRRRCRRPLCQSIGLRSGPDDFRRR